MNYILKMKKWKRAINKINKNKIFFIILLLALTIAIVGIYFFYGNNNDYNDTIVDNNKEIETISYPERIDTELLELNANAAISFYYDKEEEKILYEKNINDILPIASISKIMTALVVYDEYKVESELNISRGEVGTGANVMNFRAWENSTIEEVVHQMLIESNNSSAFALALASSRFLVETEENHNAVDLFVAEMNKKANQLGLTNTKFFNPSGLDEGSKNNKSTALEIALLSQYIIENNRTIFEISTLPYYRLYSPDKLIYYQSFNTNYFLHNNEYEWQERIVGGKTGRTIAAGECLLLVLENPNKEGYIINVILGSDDRFGEMEKLVEYIHQAYKF